jgi:hypothetical protein
MYIWKITDEHTDSVLVKAKTIQKAIAKWEKHIEDYEYDEVPTIMKLEFMCYEEELI